MNASAAFVPIAAYVESTYEGRPRLCVGRDFSALPSPHYHDHAYKMTEHYAVRLAYATNRPVLPTRDLDAFLAAGITVHVAYESRGILGPAAFANDYR